jgi:hypothetical protein
VLPKQLFYVTHDQLCAYQWQRGRLSAPERFDADADGIEGFGRYLDQHRTAPACIVADLVEEDFQRQLLPHVGGRAGRELVARRLLQLYRDTPYRRAQIQGRESEGRRDDQLLLSALTNAAAVQPWALALEQHRAPLAAIYSAALLSALLVDKLALAQDHLLLITHQSGGLRQSYFQGKELKFSRLTELGAQDDLAAHIAAETARMQQFLISTRLLVRGKLLRVVALAPAGQLPALEAVCEDDAETAFHFLDMESAAERLRLDGAPQLCDQLLLALVGRHLPASHYALGAQGRFYRLWQARLALNAGSAALAAGTALWLASAAWGIVQDGRNSTRLLAEAADDDQRYRAVMAKLPPAATRAANMKAAVQLDTLLKTQAPGPAALVALLSQSLDRVPAITLNAFDWTVAQPSDAANPIMASSVGILRAPAQQLLVEGEVAEAQGGYRNILDAVNQLALDLGRHPNTVVEMVDTPLDVRSNVKLSGKAGLGEPDANAKFSLKVSWKP